MYVADATVVSLEPNSIEGIFETVTAVGKLAGAEEKAAEVVGMLRGRLDACVNARRKRSPAEHLCSNGLSRRSHPDIGCPNRSSQQAVMLCLGGAGKPSVVTTYEAISESNPEVIVLIPCGYYASDTLRQLKDQTFPENWRDISAVKDNEVWALTQRNISRGPGRGSLTVRRYLRKYFIRKFSDRRPMTRRSV